MKKIFLYLLLLLTPTFNNANVAETKVNNDLYTIIKLEDIGLSKDIFNMAIKGFNKLENINKLKKSGIISIVDYSQSSNKKRLYVIDLINKKILFNTYVAHGKNTGEEYANLFSNEPGSLKSSLGFYITEDVKIGSHPGLSLIINGVEKGFNDNAIKRAIIIHAAEYATENFIKRTGRLGRSWGCPALPPELNTKIIETIKGGSCLFIYNSNKDYLCKSSFIN